MKAISSHPKYSIDQKNIRKSNRLVYQENITLQLAEEETDCEINPAETNKTINEFQQIIISAGDKAFGVFI